MGQIRQKGTIMSGSNMSDGKGSELGSDEIVEIAELEEIQGQRDVVETDAVEHIESPKKSFMSQLEEEGDVAADYLEALLDIADLDGDIDIDVDNDRAALSITGGALTHLVGDSGEVLDAIQELTRLAVQTSLGERSRLMLDIDNFRSDRKAELTKLAQEIAEEVKDSGEQVKLKPMNAFERKVIHDTIQELGLTSESEGEEPNRCVVVLPA
jgi:spoIIIJ-associated protein